MHPIMGTTKWGERLIDPNMGKGRTRRILAQEIRSISDSPRALLVHTTDSTATQREDNNLEHWCRTAAVATTQVRKCGTVQRLIGTENAGNLLTARALDSAATPAQTNTD